MAGWRNGPARRGAIDRQHRSAFVPRNTGGQALMTIELRDWQGNALGEDPVITVEHDSRSAGLSTIGEVQSIGPATYSVQLNAPPQAGLDLFRVTANDLVRPVVLLPLPSLPIYAVWDANLDNDVDLADAKAIAACLMGPGAPLGPLCQGRDSDGDADADLKDAHRLQLEFTDQPCDTLYLVSSPQSDLIACGFPFTVGVVVDAIPAARFRWYLNGELIPAPTPPPTTWTPPPRRMRESITSKLIIPAARSSRPRSFSRTAANAPEWGKRRNGEQPIVFPQPQAISPPFRGYNQQWAA